MRRTPTPALVTPTPNILLPNSFLLNSKGAVALSPIIVLNRLPKNWNQFTTNQLIFQSLSLQATTTPRSQQNSLLLKDELKVRMSHCVLCSSSSEDEGSSFQQVKPELVRTFNIVFNNNATSETLVSIFDPDLFICCKSCTGELELLHYFNKQVQIITRKFKSVRDKLVKIMTRNYVTKNGHDQLNKGHEGQPTASSRNNRSRSKPKTSHDCQFIDQLIEFEGWRHKLASKINQDGEDAVVNIQADLKNLRQRQQYLTLNDEHEEELIDIKEEIVDTETDRDADVEMNQQQDNQDLPFAETLEDEESTSSPSSSRRLKPKEEAEIELPMINGKFQCRFCAKLFLYKSGRNRHEKLNHLSDNRNIYHCHICGFINHGLAAFVQHLFKGHLELVAAEDTLLFYTCDESTCSQYFYTQDLLEQHIIASHGQLFTCMQCKHVFADAGHLESHLENVHPEQDEEDGRQVNCEYCHVHFQGENMLEFHKQIHLVQLDKSVEQHKCAVCRKEFGTISALNSHKLKSHKIQQPSTRKMNRSKEFLLKCRLAKSARQKARRQAKKVYFSCKVCDEEHLTFRQLRSHTARHEKNGPENGIPCKMCHKVFRTNASLSSHERFAHGTPKCRFCDKELPSMGLRRILEHEYKCNPQKYLEGKPHLCKLCMQCFITVEDLETHQKLIHEPNKCKICNTQCLNKVGLQIHLKYHAIASAKSTGMQNLPLKTNKSSISCEECNITLQNGREFRYHKSVFHSIDPNNRAFRKCKFGCQDKTFIKVTLQRKHYVECHAQQHLNKNGSVYCEKCYKVFRNDAELAEHMKIHEEEDAHLFQCETCGKQFRKKINFDNHKFIHQSDHEGFSCEICGQIFKTPIPLTVHRKMHSITGNNTAESVRKVSEPKKKRRPPIFSNLPCEYGCGIKTLINFYLQRRHYVISHAELHLKGGQVNCKKCFEVFKDEGLLEEHSKEHNIKELQCQVCGKQFMNKVSFKSHKYEHLNVNDGFTCEVCGKTFQKPMSLKLHSKSHTNQSYHRTNCKHCGKNLCRGKAMNRHLYMEHREEYLKDTPFHCEVCYAAFISSELLEKHWNIHSKCKFCGRLFEVSYKLKEHENSRTGNSHMNAKIVGDVLVLMQT